jgi:hypothetical protein
VAELAGPQEITTEHPARIKALAAQGHIAALAAVVAVAARPVRLAPGETAAHLAAELAAEEAHQAQAPQPMAV